MKATRARDGTAVVFEVTEFRRVRRSRFLLSLNREQIALDSAGVISKASESLGFFRFVNLFASDGCEDHLQSEHIQ
jgi:hypothetical protein